MSTWDELDEETNEEEAIMTLMASTIYDVESEVDYDDDDEVFSKLTREEVVNSMSLSYQIIKLNFFYKGNMI